MFNYSLLIIGVYLIITSLIANCPDVKSNLFLKALPFLSGLYLILMFLMNQGWIVIK